MWTNIFIPQIKYIDSFIESANCSLNQSVVIMRPRIHLGGLDTGILNKYFSLNQTKRIPRLR